MVVPVDAYLLSATVRGVRQFEDGNYSPLCGADVEPPDVSKAMGPKLFDPAKNGGCAMGPLSWAVFGRVENGWPLTLLLWLPQPCDVTARCWGEILRIPRTACPGG
jgi:hypothetical protein